MLGIRLKILIIFGILLIAGFSILNVVSFLEFKRLLDMYIYQKVYTAYINYLSTGAKSVDNVRILKHPEEGYIVYSFPSEGFGMDHIYVGIEKKEVDELVNHYMTVIVIWEAVLVFMIIIGTFVIVTKLLREIEEHRKFMDLVLMSISHKFGNFIAIQRVNLGILDKNYDRKAVNRLMIASRKLERDIKTIIHLLERRAEERIQIEPVNVADIFKKLIKEFSEELKKKRISYSIKDTVINANIIDMEDLAYNLLSNAVKHSKSRIHLKICKGKEHVLIAVRNDRVEEEKEGMGLGMEIIKSIVQRYKGTVRIKVKRYFSVFVIIPVR